MKKIIILLSILIPSLCFGQYKYYKDSTYMQGFSFLTAATSVNNNMHWDDPEFAIPLGFTFHMFGDTTNTLHISQEIGMGAYITTDSVTATTPYATGIIAFGSDLVDRDTSGSGSLSPISYSLSGTAPSRICKIEWKNTGFFNPIDNATSYADSVNLQLWVYEGSDVIEVRFGNGNYVSSNSDLYDGGPGPLVGLFDSIDVNFNGNVYYLKDTVTAPSLDSTNSLYSSAFPPGMNGKPVAGSVYRFIPIQGGIATGYTNINSVVSHDMDYISERHEVRIDIFSNDVFRYTLGDIEGKPISTGRISKGRTVVNTESLAEGMYIVQLTSEKEHSTMKFVK